MSHPDLSDAPESRTPEANSKEGNSPLESVLESGAPAVDQTAPSGRSVAESSATARGAAGLNSSDSPLTDEQPIDLLAYLRRVLRFWKPALLVGLVSALAVGLVLGLTSGSKVMYNTKAHVMLQPTWTDSENAVAESNLVSEYMRTYVALGTSDTITKDVSAAVHNKYTPQQIGQMMQVFWGGGSLLLAVQVSAPNHQDALDIAEAGANALVAHQADLVALPATKAPHITLVQHAFDAPVPTTGGTSELKSALMPAVGAGIALTVLTALVLEALSVRRRRRTQPARTTTA